ncbi:MAG: vWA domain-containing protein, partial [Acidobacteriota bacterium]
GEKGLTRVPTGIDFAGLRFAAPGYLPLLVAPLVFLLVWGLQAWRRHHDVIAMRRHRQLPTRFHTERLPVLGELTFWLCLIAALTVTIVALARPVAVASMVRTSGIDLVVLQDGSASMRVRDVQDDRWRRSMSFLRSLAEALQWDDDRIALALFATIAAPQVRLTRDPNTFFFFLDHLEGEPPFRLEDETTWDTNIERGIYWGLRLIEKDEELARGAPRRPADARPPGSPNPAPSSRNPKAFVLVSDGQAWSGSVAKSLSVAQERRIPVFVVGVGTTAGGVIPEPPQAAPRPPVSSTLDRASLSVLATAGGGRYFELDRESDRDIANSIIDITRRRADAADIEESTRDLYWSALALGAVFLGVGVLFLRDRASLGLQVAAAVGVLVVLSRLS